MPASATATVPLLRTLVLCDLVDSTALVQRLGDQRAAELIRKHDRVVRALLPLRGGREIDKTDGFLALFDRPIQAVAFALDYQRSLRELNANEKTTLGARVGIHVGDILTWDNTPDDIAKGAKLTEVEGLVKPITSRLMQLALPGQILLSGVAYSLAHRAQGELGERLATARWRTHGRYRFKGIPDPIPVFEIGEEGHAPLKPPPWSGKAHREVPFWRRPATVVVEGALLLALVAIPAWYLLKPAPAIAFANRDWVVVGDLKNLTGQASFDESLETAFRIGLEQSRYVNVLSDLKTRETVKLMQRDPEQTKIDRAIGAEVAIRDGARALILPTVAEIGGRVRVTAEVIDPQTQTTVYSESADGVGEASVLPSLDKVNQQLRVRLGEALATVSNESKPLDRVATKNLDALRAYGLGQKEYGAGNMQQALSLFQRAVDLDSGFALAHISIAQIHNNANANEAALEEIRAAASSRDRLSSKDALYVEAWQATIEAPRDALEKWKLLTTLYPDYFAAQGLYGYFNWQYANKYDEAIAALTKAAAQQNPHRDISEYVLGVLYLGKERYNEALGHLKNAASRGLADVSYQRYAYAAQRQFENAEKANPAGAAAESDVSLSVDRGDWARVWSLLDAPQPTAAASTNARAQSLIALSLHSAVGDERINPARLKAAIEAEKLASTLGTPADRAEANFRALFTAFIAAQNQDTELAKSLSRSVNEGAARSGYPTIANMERVLDAELARSADDHKNAVEKLRALMDGNELLVTHVALMEAYASAGQYDAARTEARWLSSHRGRAYTEYNADWVLRPYNVAQTTLALLREAELSQRLNDKSASSHAVEEFLKAWPDAGRSASIQQRLKSLQP
ncbi:MAG: putative peptide modification system cyclase [Dokdonella sp.]